MSKRNRNVPGLSSLSAAVSPPAAARARYVAPVYRAPLSNISEGFLTNFLNPASATLPGRRAAVRAAGCSSCAERAATEVHVATALTWHLVWAAAGAALARTLSAGPARRALDGATAVALLLLAVRVLTRQ